MHPFFFVPFPSPRSRSRKEIFQTIFRTSTLPRVSQGEIRAAVSIKVPFSRRDYCCCRRLTGRIFISSAASAPPPPVLSQSERYSGDLSSEKSIPRSRVFYGQSLSRPDRILPPQFTSALIQLNASSGDSRRGYSPFRSSVSPSLSLSMENVHD